MKCRSLAVILIMAMILSLFSGCGGNSSETTSESETIYGEVSKIENNTITIKVGTMKEIEKSSEKKEDSETATGDDSAAKENGGQQELKDGDKMSMLELTGEEQEIKITDDTVITKQQMGGHQGGKQGNPPEQQSGDQPDNNNQGNPPELPSGDNSQDTPPEMPTGEQQSGDGQENPPQIPENESDKDSGTRPDMSEGEGMGQQETEKITLDDISEGDTVAITLDDDGSAAEITVMSIGGGEQPGGTQASGVDSYTSVKEYTTDTTVEKETYNSTGTDENAIHVLNGAEVMLKNIEVTRTSSDSTGGDNSSFYGVGAAILTTEGTSYISGSTISTDAAGAAGIFAYGDGVVYTSDTTIKTQQDTSGGIHAAGGGTLYAWDMDVETNGESSAAIRSDRGGGKMVVEGGTYTSNGVGSPAIYSTADIAVSDAELTANGSEAICIEGLNSIHLYNSNLTGNMSDDSQNDCTWNVILYQSMSGDSEVGNSTFEMSGGTLTAKNGGMFYTTNTESTFTLENIDITYADDSEFFLRCTGNNNQRGWGTTGSNGADCLFTAINQKMEGDIVWDSISMLDFYITDGSTLKGAVKNDETYAGDGGDGYCSIYIEKGCTWTVTGDSTVSKLYNAGTIKDTEGKTVSIKGTDGTVYVEGDSRYTITVDSYSTTADLSGASSITEWSDYKVEKIV